MRSRSQESRGVRPATGRPTRRRSVASHTATPYIFFSLVIGLVALLFYWLGPINFQGRSRRELGRFFLVVGIPILVSMFAYDPVVRTLDRVLYPQERRDPSLPEDRKSPVEVDREGKRAEERALKRACVRPISSHSATPWVYWAAIIGGFAAIGEVLDWLGLFRSYHDSTTEFVLVMGAVLTGLLAYDPILRFLDDRFSS